MLFNSFEFLLFLPIVFICYWLIPAKKLKFQNLLVLIASYIFYGWWDYRFLGLILFSTIVDYFIGILMYKSTTNSLKKVLLTISILVNIGLLMFFKYFNFFIESWVDAWAVLEISMNVSSLSIILPVGISFYTFQTLSYSIDIYRGKLKPSTDFISFAAFVSFFPQLVAGPIERATNLLPQFQKLRRFDYSKSADGMRQILWGLFMKIVVADNCSKYVNLIFDNSTAYSGSTLVLGAVLFAFQIYGDFAGYSNIAIGTSRLFGFNLKQNFNFPYFSRDIAEFWRKWHISLSTWFRDYLYIPLGGSRGGMFLKIRNVFIIFIVSGFWHGANWTFIIWGALNALYFLPVLLRNKNRVNLDTVAAGKQLPTLNEFLQITATFSLTVFAWIFFRAESLSHATQYIEDIFSNTLFKLPEIRPSDLFILIVLFVIVEWFGRKGRYALEKIGSSFPGYIRYPVYVTIVVLLFLFSGGNEQEFIYFQF